MGTSVIKKKSIHIFLREMSNIEGKFQNNNFKPQSIDESAEDNIPEDWKDNGEIVIKHIQPKAIETGIILLIDQVSDYFL